MKKLLTTILLLLPLLSIGEEITYPENSVGYFFAAIDEADGQATETQIEDLVNAYQSAAAAFAKTVAIMDEELARTASDACKAVGIERPSGVLKRLRKWMEQESAQEMEFSAAVGFHAANRCAKAIALL